MAKMRLIGRHPLATRRTRRTRSRTRRARGTGRSRPRRRRPVSAILRQPSIAHPTTERYWIGWIHFGRIDIWKNAPPTAAWIWMRSGPMPPTARCVLATAPMSVAETRDRSHLGHGDEQRRDAVAAPVHVEHEGGERVAGRRTARRRARRCRASSRRRWSFSAWAKRACAPSSARRAPAHSDDAPNIAPNIRNIAVIERL